MTVDSTVLIDLLNGNDRAKDYISSVNQKTNISRVVLMEIIAGCRNKTEISRSLKTIKDLKLEIIEISEIISRQAGDIFLTYFHQFGLSISDALIAATSLILDEKLVTHNVKHFKFIKGLDLIVPY